MTFIEAIRSYFKNYATFSGRARRSEFWYAVLFTTLVSVAISIVAPGHTESMSGMDWTQNSPLYDLWSLATLVPSLALFWRRMHDVDKSGAWFFFLFIPLVGLIMVLVKLVKDGQPAANRFGAPVKVASKE